MSASRVSVARFEAAQTAVDAATRAWQLSAGALPTAPGPNCPHCGGTAFKVVEGGHMRFMRAVRSDDGVWDVAQTGLEDYTEDGAVGWLECDRFDNGCGAVFSLPDDIEWSADIELS
jgi:hypothetical protein